MGTESMRYEWMEKLHLPVVRQGSGLRSRMLVRDSVFLRLLTGLGRVLVGGFGQ